MNKKSALLGGVIAFLLLSDVLANDISLDGELDESPWKASAVHTLNYQVIPQTLAKQQGNFSYQVITTDTGIFLV